MNHILRILIGFTIGAILFGCAGPRQLAADRETAWAEGTLPDSLAQNDPAPAMIGAVDSLRLAPHASLLARLLGRQPAPVTYHKPTRLIGKVGKKATIAIYQAPATVTTVGKKGTTAVGEGASAVSGKKAGPILRADSGATLDYATVARGQAAAGAGITQQQTELKKGFPWSAVGSGLGILFGIGFIYWLVAGGGLLFLGGLLQGLRYWVAGWFRRKQEAPAVATPLATASAAAPAPAPPVAVAPLAGNPVYLPTPASPAPSPPALP